MKKFLLFLKPGPMPENGEFLEASVYGAVVIPNDVEPSQDFINAAWAEGMQVAAYDYHPEEETHQEWPQELFQAGKLLADKINNLLMAKYN